MAPLATACEAVPLVSSTTDPKSGLAHGTQIALSPNSINRWEASASTRGIAIEEIQVTNKGAPAPGPATRLLKAMMRPKFYPHPCDRVELRQTMTSWLLFAGSLVYKIKRPLRFGLTDATTPLKRYRLCQDEILLNRPLAADLYLGVSSIAETLAGYVLTGETSDRPSRAREFAVVMRRLPSDRFLDQMVANASIMPGAIQIIARKLMAFHTEASMAQAQLWGSAQAISQLITSNLAEAHELAADSLTRKSIGAVKNYAVRFVTTHQQSLNNRARDGWVRAGHGDLRCESVCLDSRGVIVIGRSKHHERWRYVDAGLELASLAVDLDLLGRSDLANELIETYVTDANDQGAIRLLRFYKSYRAVVQGKCQTLVSLRTDLPTEQRLSARENARRLFTLAHRYASGTDATSIS